MAVLGICLSSTALAADPESCATVRMADPGWTDITSTNAIAGVLLEGLGYEQEVQLIGVPISFRSLQNGDIDVFLGNWMPTQTAMVEPMLAEKSVTLLTDNLSGLRFTLAVPSYVAEAGVKSVTDLAAHADRFDRKIFSIEPGASVNENIRRMLADGAYGLSGWEMVESSEQGMLGQVDKAVRDQEWILFIAWEPHPMNTKLDFVYLPGADEYFGPNLGSATVRTLSRTTFPAECPNLTKLFAQLHFTKDMENEMMVAIIDDGAEAEDAAREYLKAHPEVLDTWLAGVTTADGQDGLAAVKEELGL